MGQKLDQLDERLQRVPEMAFESASWARRPSTRMRIARPPVSRGSRTGPSTNFQDEQLSATTSGREKYLKPVKRESRISNAGATPCNAAKASLRERWPESCRPVTNAISGSTFGCTPSPTRKEPSTRIASVSTP
jgi:hypothetical protein